MVWRNWYMDKMVWRTKWYWTKWYGQTGTDKMVRIKSSINQSHSHWQYYCSSIRLPLDPFRFPLCVCHLYGTSGYLCKLNSIELKSIKKLLPFCLYHFVQFRFVRVPFCPYHFVRSPFSLDIRESFKQMHQPYNVHLYLSVYIVPSRTSSRFYTVSVLLYTINSHVWSSFQSNTIIKYVQGSSTCLPPRLNSKHHPK